MLDLADLINAASKLDRSERAALISSLLENLETSPHHVTDDEALDRLESLKSGKTKGLTDEQFWAACPPRLSFPPTSSPPKKDPPGVAPEGNLTVQTCKI